VTRDQARARFATAPVARLATIDSAGGPHIVPMVFAVAGDTIYSAVDDKPKRTRRLRRLDNVAANPSVAVLADHYDEDWRRLWWVRAEGAARVLDAEEPEGRDAIALLAERYPQYREQPPAGPVLAIDVERWSGWQATGPSAGD
jgi:PPOX class probable F420-dependent enzyme